MTRVADNPHKPGTTEHADWEREHIHDPRAYGLLDHPHMLAVADGRIARLKADIAARRNWVDDILDEVADATRPEPRMSDLSGLLGPSYSLAGIRADLWASYVVYQPSAFVNLTGLNV